MSPKSQTIDEKINELEVAHCFSFIPTKDMMMADDMVCAVVHNNYRLIETQKDDLKARLFKCLSYIRIGSRTYFIIRKPYADDSPSWRYYEKLVTIPQVFAHKYIDFKPKEFIQTHCKPYKVNDDKRTSKKTMLEYLTKDIQPNYQYKLPKEPKTVILANSPFPHSENKAFCNTETMYMVCFIQHLIYTTRMHFQELCIGETYTFEPDGTTFTPDIQHKDITMKYADVKKLLPLKTYRKLGKNLEHSKANNLFDYQRQGDYITFTINPAHFIANLKSEWLTTNGDTVKNKQFGYATVPLEFILNVLSEKNLTRNAFNFISFILHMLANNRPRILHSLDSLIDLCGISRKIPKPKILARLNKYFKYLETWGVVKNFEPLLLADFLLPNLNIKLYQFADKPTPASDTDT